MRFRVFLRGKSGAGSGLSPLRTQGSILDSRFRSNQERLLSGQYAICIYSGFRFLDIVNLLMQFIGGRPVSLPIMIQVPEFSN